MMPMMIIGIIVLGLRKCCITSATGEIVMLMIVTTLDNLDHPNNVVKLVEVVDDPEEVHPDADDDHWNHSFRMLRKCCITSCSSNWRN